MIKLQRFEHILGFGDYEMFSRMNYENICEETLTFQPRVIGLDPYLLHFAIPCDQTVPPGSWVAKYSSRVKSKV